MEERHQTEKDWFGVFFYCIVKRKEGQVKEDRVIPKAGSYDRDGCYCLFIAILTGLNASKARMLYLHGTRAPTVKEDEKRLLINSRPLDKERKKETMKKMRSNGYSLERIAEFLDCDPTTVKRNLKRAQDKRMGSEK